MVDLNRKSRKIDLDKLSPEDLDRIGQELGKTVGEILSEASKKVNKLLNIYGLETHISYTPFDKIEEE